MGRKGNVTSHRYDSHLLDSNEVKSCREERNGSVI